MFDIRRVEDRDWAPVWALLEPVIRAGETYAFARDIVERDARAAWFDAPTATFVATDDGGGVLGTYYIKPNHPGGGAHVCNCGYVVATGARGQGVASAMCEHSQREAVALGFQAMQFNLVVVTNDVALRLWEKLGFTRVGILPGAFRHPRLGFVDACVMYKRLRS
jgi:RimJ/RimL family protein N-acetyltransferase